MHCNEQIREQWEVGVQQSKVEDFMRMVRFHQHLTGISFNNCNFQPRDDLWSASANKLTNVIQQIIEFAKMLPGFMKLQQDDQIVLLKSGEAMFFLFQRRPNQCNANSKVDDFLTPDIFREFRAGDHSDESLL